MESIDWPFWSRVASFLLWTSLLILTPTLGPRALDRVADRAHVALIRRGWKRHKRRR